jgi:hypothetical protein
MLKDVCMVFLGRFFGACFPMLARGSGGRTTGAEAAQNQKALDSLVFVGNNTDSLSFVGKLSVVHKDLRAHFFNDPVAQLMRACKHGDLGFLPASGAFQKMPGKPFSCEALAKPENLVAYAQLMQHLVGLIEHSATQACSLTQRKRLADLCMEAVSEPKRDDCLKKLAMTFQFEKLRVMRDFCSGVYRACNEEMQEIEVFEQALHLIRILNRPGISFVGVPVETAQRQVFHVGCCGAARFVA